MANIRVGRETEPQDDQAPCTNRAALANVRTAVKHARTAVDAKAGDAGELAQGRRVHDRWVGDEAAILKRGTASRYVSRLVTRAARSSRLDDSAWVPGAAISIAAR